ARLGPVARGGSGMSELIVPALRDAVYRRVQSLVDAWLTSTGLRTGCTAGLCLHYARFGMEEIAAVPGAPRVCVQAGTAFWPRVPLDQDDGGVVSELRLSVGRAAPRDPPGPGRRPAGARVRGCLAGDACLAGPAGQPGADRKCGAPRYVAYPRFPPP